MSKAVIQPFLEYQKSRIVFAQTVMTLSRKADYVPSLKKLGVLKLISPLLSDPIPSVKQCAAFSISQLIKNDTNNEIANSVINEDKGRLFNEMMANLDDDKHYREAVLLTISKIASKKENRSLALKIADSGAIKFIVSCLEGYWPALKVQAACAIAHLADHDLKIAAEFVNEKVIDTLVSCIQEPDLKLKKYSASALTSIAKHSSLNALKIATDKENLNTILFFVSHKDYSLKNQVLLCLSALAHHSNETGYNIVSKINSNDIEDCINGENLACQQNTFKLLGDIASGGLDNANTVLQKIKCETVARYIETNSGMPIFFPTYLIITLASYGKDQAENLMKVNIHKSLALALYNPMNDEQVLSNVCIAIKLLASHNDDINNRIADNIDYNNNVLNIPLKLLEYAISRKLTPYIKENAKSSLEKILEKCTVINYLIALLVKPDDLIDKKAYESILVLTIRRMRDILYASSGENMKKEFIRNKTLKKIIDLKTYYDGIREELIEFSRLYPPEIMNYFSDEYEREMKEKYLKETI